MRRSLLAVWATLAASVYAATIPPSEQAILSPSSPELFLVETGPDTQQWISEEQKWELRRQGVNFIDITETQELGGHVTPSTVVKFPKQVAYNKTIRPLLKELNKTNMREHLELFTSFHTRFYRSDYGKQSAHWLLEQVRDTVNASGAFKHGASVKAFDHSWGQPSIIAQIPGQSNKTIVIGAHQDSINLFLPWVFAAPGADDDGSGTVTILEALRVLLQSDKIVQGNASNTIEFHWYSAEEGGLLGSQAVFSAYKKQKRDVKAMLQQDMTGYVQATLDAGMPESVGVITDYVDPGLTEFIKEIITEYCDIPYVLTKCGYACSDHASASKAGYPSAFVIESDFEHSETSRIHTGEDKIEFLSFDHMLQHAKLTLSLAYELAFAKFE